MTGRPALPGDPRHGDFPRRGCVSQADVTPMLSVVIPIFNEEETLEALFERLRSSLEALGEEFEVIFVNDGSRDRSEKMLREFHTRDPRFRSIHFSRNFGHQTAITCGLDHSR